MKYKLFFLVCLASIVNTQASAQALHWLTKPVLELGTVPNGSTNQAKISANGRFTVFSSDASNLIDNDNNHLNDVFLYDNLNNTTQRVNSLGGSTTFTVDYFTKPTSDGSKIVFTSTDSQVGNISNPDNDRYVYLKNMTDNSVTLLSLDLEGDPIEFASSNVGLILSDDGQSLFLNTRENLDPLHNSLTDQAYKKSLIDNTYELISQSVDGTQAADRRVRIDSVSPDGRFVVFRTGAGNLLDISLSRTQLLRKDLTDNSYELVTRTPNGDEPATNSVQSFGSNAISAVANNGNVAFITGSAELDVADNNNSEDVYLFNGTNNIRISLDENGQEVDTVFGIDSIDISGDATKVAFSTAADLIGTQNGIFIRDVYIYDIGNQSIEIVSKGFQGQDTNDSSLVRGFSVDADQLILTSSATNLIFGPNNKLTNIYNYDHNSQVLSLVNPAVSDIISSTHNNARAKSSSDQRYVVMQTRNPNLVPLGEDERAQDNLILLDRETDVYTLVGRRMFYDDFDISPSGRYIVFGSQYFQPSAEINLGSDQLFIYDRINQTYQQITSGYEVSINDGGQMLFRTNEALVNNDTNNTLDLYLYDIPTNTFNLISVDLSGMAAGGVFSGDINNTPNDTQIVFSSSSSDMTASDINGLNDIFITQWPNGNIRRVSQATSGAGGNGNSTFTKISDDGLTVLMTSSAKNLTNNDYTNASENQLFLYDVGTEEIELVTKDTSGAPFTGVSLDGFNRPSLSNSGRYVSYSLTGLSPLGGDNDTSSDVFLYDDMNGVTEIITQRENGSQLDERNFQFTSVVDDTSVTPSLVGVLFTGVHELTGINNHPGVSEIYLYQKGGPDVELNISVEGSGTGTVSGSQSISCMSGCDYSFPLGTDLILVASADAGSEFDRWQSSRGQCTDNSNPCRLDMTRDKQLTAVFIDENDVIFKAGFE